MTRRICEGIASQDELPRLSASVGVAVYPEDGDSLLALLASADHALYEQKGRTLRRLTTVG